MDGLIYLHLFQIDFGGLVIQNIINSIYYISVPLSYLPLLQKITSALLDLRLKIQNISKFTSK